MGFFTIRKKKGRDYVYFEERGWKEGKVVRTYQKYLGPRDQFTDLPTGHRIELKASDIETKSYECGISSALWSIVEELNLEQILRARLDLPSFPNASIYFLLAAINRVAAPCSKTQLSTWYQNDWLFLRYPQYLSLLNSREHWDLSQQLSSEHFEKVELDLAKILQDRYGLSQDRLLYDATNIFTFGTPDLPEGLRRFGHSKENRNNLPLVQYYLLCSKPWGFPLLHQTYSGNIQDAEAFKSIPKKITDHWQQLGYQPENITLSFDKGNLSPEAFMEIDSRKLHFIASVRNSTQKDLLKVPPSEFITTQLPGSGKIVRYYLSQRKIYDQNRTVIVIIDPAKKERHRIKFEAQLKKKQQEIHEFITNQLNIKKWRDEDAVKTKIASIIGKKPWNAIIIPEITGNYGSLNAKILINSIAIQQHIESMGRSIIFTNLTGWSPEDIIWAYREQYLVERAFALMKDPQTIAIRPIFHSNPKSIEAHIFICVLALWMLAVLKYKFNKRKIFVSYDDIIRDLRPLHATRVFLSSTGTAIMKLDKPSIRAVKYIALCHLKPLITGGKNTL